MATDHLENPREMLNSSETKRLAFHSGFGHVRGALGPCAGHSRACPRFPQDSPLSIQEKHGAAQESPKTA
eukprot:4170329-Pyramimonas_sp.AAC.1